ncbi:hypothetical protein QOT17_010007 [Balamuthia mandrillaris]
MVASPGVGGSAKKKKKKGKEEKESDALSSHLLKVFFVLSCSSYRSIRLSFSSLASISLIFFFSFSFFRGLVEASFCSPSVQSLFLHSNIPFKSFSFSLCLSPKISVLLSLFVFF